MDRGAMMTIPAVGPITALTWALEVGDAQRFSSIKKAITTAVVWCGEEFRHTVQPRAVETRNKHLQSTLIERQRWRALQPELSDAL